MSREGECAPPHPVLEASVHTLCGTLEKLRGVPFTTKVGDEEEVMVVEESLRPCCLLWKNTWERREAEVKVVSDAALGPQTLTCQLSVPISSETIFFREEDQELAE